MTPPAQSEPSDRPVRSLGAEYPVDGDPAKVHGVVVESGESRWRAECMACGYLGRLQDAPWKARAMAVQHTTGGRHHVCLAQARKKQREAA